MQSRLLTLYTNWKEFYMRTFAQLQKIVQVDAPKIINQGFSETQTTDSTKNTSDELSQSKLVNSNQETQSLKKIHRSRSRSQKSDDTDSSQENRSKNLYTSGTRSKHFSNQEIKKSKVQQPSLISEAIKALNYKPPVKPIQFIPSMLQKVKIDQQVTIASLDEYYTQIIREQKVKSRMFQAYQPQDPFYEQSYTFNWKENLQNIVVDMENLYRQQIDQFQMYNQIRLVVENDQFQEKEDIMLSLINQIDHKLIKHRTDYEIIDQNIEKFKKTLINSKNQRIQAQQAEALAREQERQTQLQLQKLNQMNQNTQPQFKLQYSLPNQYNHRYQFQMNQNPRKFQNKGPKSYPCKYFHGYRGCNMGENCVFIHEPAFQGQRIPYNEMERVIAEYSIQPSKHIKTAANK
eukprot:403340264